MELSDRVVVMNQGLVEQIGSPQEIYDHPATTFVASFVGAANIFHGRVEGGRAMLGGMDMAVSGAEGSQVQAYVRPHDVRVELAPSDGVATATILKMTHMGWAVKLELRLADGQPLTVQLTRDTVDELRVVEGDTVFVNLREAKVFVQDYSI